MRGAEARQRGEEPQVEVTLREIDGQERSRGDVEVERPPARRHAGVGQRLVQQAAGLGAGETAYDTALGESDFSRIQRCTSLPLSAQTIPTY